MTAVKSTQFFNLLINIQDIGKNIFIIYLFTNFYKKLPLHKRCFSLAAQNGRHGNTKTFKKVTHCLFDMDGTILDSEIIYHNVITEICERYGKIYSRELQMKMYGLPDRQLGAALVRELGLPMNTEEFNTQLQNSVRKLLPRAPLKEGAERLLKHLYNFKIPFALVTNSTASSVRTHADAWPKLFRMFHHKVCITDLGVWRGKPHPEIFLTASSRFCPKPSPNQCLVFEDSEVGVEAALRAGMQVVMIPGRHLKNPSHNATLIIQSLVDFKPEFFGLPPFYDAPV